MLILPEEEDGVVGHGDGADDGEQCVPAGQNADHLRTSHWLTFVLEYTYLKRQCHKICNLVFLITHLTISDLVKLAEIFEV